MSESKIGTSRREFLRSTSRIAVASALASAAAPRVHAAEDNTLQVALIGCGGRGTGAAADALSVKQGPVKLVAMADIFEDRLSGSFKNLIDRFAAQVDVPEDRKFVGFDAYKKAMDCSNGRYRDLRLAAHVPWVISPVPSKKGCTSSWKSR